MVGKKQKKEVGIEQISQNYESFFNSIDDFLFVLDEQGNISQVNKTVIQRLGYTKEELIGKSILSLHPKERRSEAEEIVKEMLLGKVSTCLVPIITKNGIQIPVETRITHGTWDDKPVLFGVTKDISEIKLSEEKFLKVFDLNPSACGLSDLETHKYLEVNKAFTDLLGYKPNEVIGKTATELGILSSQTVSYILEKADKNGNVKDAEADIISKNGEIKRVLLSSENIFVQERQYRFTVVNDITKRMLEEDELMEREQILKKSLIASSELIDINTEQINYSKFADTILKMSGATYVSFNLFEENGLDFVTVALSGVNEHLKTVTSLLGFEIINRKWKHDPVRAKKIKNNTTTIFNSLHDLTGVVVSKKTSLFIEKTFNIGNVAVVRMQKNKVAIGDFTLLFSKSNSLKNKEIVELYTNQIGLLIGRIRSEKKLAESESQYRGYINNSPIGVFVCDETGRYLQANPAATKITGYSNSELLSMIIPDLLPPSSQKFATKLFREVVKNGSAKSEFDYLHKDGHMGTWSFEGVRISQTNFMGMCTDITERKKIEDALKDSEVRYRILAEDSPIAIEYYDSKGLLLNVNPACLKLFGIKNTKEIERFSLFDDPNISEVYKNKLRQGKTVEYEAAFDFDKVKEANLYETTKSGQVWLGVSITPTMDIQNKTSGYLLEIQDITEKRQQERALVIAKTRLELALQSSNMGVWQFIVSEKKYIFDRQTCNLLNINPDKSTGSAEEFIATVHPEDREAVKAALLETVKMDVPYEPDFRIILPNGYLRYLSIRGGTSQIKDSSKIINGVIWDVTNIMEAKEMLLLKTAMLEAQVNSTIDGILIVDKQQKRVLINSRIIELFDVPKHIVENVDDSKLLKYVVSLTINPDIFVEKVRYLYDHPKDVSRDEIEFKNGMVLDRYSAPVIGANGDNYGRIWIFRDITKQKQENESMKNVVEKLEKLNDLMVGRELKMIELKEEIKKLKAESN